MDGPITGSALNMKSGMKYDMQIRTCPVQECDQIGGE